MIQASQFPSGTVVYMLATSTNVIPQGYRPPPPTLEEQARSLITHIEGFASDTTGIYLLLGVVLLICLLGLLLSYKG